MRVSNPPRATMLAVLVAVMLTGGACAHSPDPSPTGPTGPSGPSGQTTPVITWANPASITAGTALGSAQLNATANVPGTFAYSPAAGTVLTAGTHTLSTTFTPNDRTTYATAAKSVTITVTGGTTGSAVIYTTASLGWSSISVTVGSTNVGTLTQYVTSQPGCGSSSPGALVVSLPAGNYSLSATANTGTTWNGTLTIVAGSCSPYVLSCPNGNCGSSGSSTGMRTTLCGTVNALSNTNWATMPNLTGLDVKLYFNTLFNTAEVQFRNRYQSVINFSFTVYRAGISPPPATVYRTSYAAGHVDSGSVGTGATTGVSLGGQACVVVDQIRFGADSGPYYNP